MSIYAPSEERFQSLLRISRASIATPPWFAAPVEAEENEDSICVTFQCAGGPRPGSRPRE